MPPEEFLKMSPALKPEDIAAGVLYVLGAPPHVQVRAVCDVMFYSDFRNSVEQSFDREGYSWKDGQVSLPCTHQPSTCPQTQPHNSTLSLPSSYIQIYARVFKVVSIQPRFQPKSCK